MKYQYEQLNEQAFQHLVQALIVAEHPETLCLPVAQPDGGRDAIRYHPDNSGFVVYQVKYSRDPTTKSERDAIEAIVSSERTKVDSLIKRGATKYYLVTNIAGTSHLDRGSIDRANGALREAFNIPCFVWWRDELDRRLDNSTDTKWSYPEILRATDVLPRLLSWGNGLRGAEVTRQIKSYMAAQCANDREIKFKQIELKKSLIDLFVDLPIRRKRQREDHTRPDQRQRIDIRQGIDGYLAQLDLEVEQHSEESSTPDSRWLAAAFWLNMPLFDGVTRFVLEGAPGQGKSTVTQLISQVSRLRLLHKKTEVDRVEGHHKAGPARTAFRLDLRDYAAWINGRHPFASDSRREGTGGPSLESFLAMQVSWEGGGGEFTERDLLDVLERAHCVVVLDGFDEVADIETRRRLVSEICLASERLEVCARSIQMIVTSRPAAFANSPGFPEDEWVHLELEDLRTGNILLYKDKWAAGQGLKADEFEGLSRTLVDKLEEPHLRDLARNPMQLAILLHLMHAQGVALPEKRTALYEDYMRLFFNREAEKAPIVREHRELMLAIHGALAWEMQIDSEQGKGSGSLSKEMLVEKIRVYLESEGHDRSLVDPLLTGSVERVGALVSRVEGTFEFEVQPLREYFAARHLYRTAAYAPPGKHRSGTRPDRFDALIRSSYWTNVTRFFCGFYDVGELGTLVDGFVQLDDEDGYRLINQPRRVALMLLSDHVFGESPRTMNRLIEYLAKDPAFERLAVSDWGFERTEIALPKTAGRQVLFKICLSRLKNEDDPERRRLLRQVIRSNADPKTLLDLWKERFRKRLMKDDPFDEALDFDIMQSLSSSEIKEYTRDRVYDRARWLAANERFGDIVSDDEVLRVLHEAFFEGRASFFHRPAKFRRWSDLVELSVLLRPNALAYLCHANSSEESARSLLSRSWGFAAGELVDQVHEDVDQTDVDSVGRLRRFIVDHMNSDVEAWQTKLRLWSELVDEGLKIAPQSLLFRQIAAISTGIGAVDDAATWGSDSFRATKGIVSRLYFARSKSGDTVWWKSRLSEVASDGVGLCLAVLFSWGEAEVLQSLRSIYEPIVAGLDEREWEQLYDLCRWVRSAARADASDSVDRWVADVGVCLPRVSFLVISRVRDGEARRKFSREAFAAHAGMEPFILRDVADTELIEDGKAADRVDWEHVTRVSKLARKAGLRYVWSVHWPQHEWGVPEDVAEVVLSDVGEHSAQFVGICERGYGARLGERARPVSGVASTERWFARMEDEKIRREEV